MKLVLRVVGLLAVGLVVLSACASSEEAGCTGDKECPTGQICLSGACQVQGCTGAGDCYQGQTCVDVDGDGAKECTAVECTVDADCDTKAAAAGVQMECRLGACLAKEVEADVTADIPKEDVEVVEEVEDTTQTGGALCQPCEKDDDCKGDLCTVLPEGDFCLPLCATNADCPSGFFCLEITSQGKQCVPGLYNKCADCLVSGCPAGQYCAQAEGVCKAAKAQCEPCVQDDECGFGARCFAFAPGDRRCIPECDSGACPAKSACQNLTGQQGTEGAAACVPQGSACCFGEQCSIVDCSNEPINKYTSPEGQCVRCLTDAHCPVEAPDCTATYECASPNCAAPTPIACAQGCCECTNNTHCTNPAKPNCDVASGLCVEGSSECGCVAPYPGCITVDGQVMCVECDKDEHCNSGCICDTNQYVCVNPSGGGYCNAGLTGCTDDCTVNGCYDPTGTYPNLKCDPESKCCYDGGGACDNVSAFCIQPGQECKSIFDIFGGGMMGGGLPGLPGGTMPGMGFCNCSGSLEAGLACMLGGLGGGLPGMGTSGDVICCPDGMLCMDVMQLMGALGGTGTPATTDSGFCVDLGSLLGGIAP